MRSALSSKAGQKGFVILDWLSFAGDLKQPTLRSGEGRDSVFQLRELVTRDWCRVFS